jgi:hypothetical protein
MAEAADGVAAERRVDLVDHEAVQTGDRLDGAALPRPSARGRCRRPPRQATV